MKRIIVAALAITALVVVCLLSMTSCSEELAAPTGFKFDIDTQTLKWNKVPGARAYSIQVEGEERVKSTKANYFSLEYLKEGTYTVKVCAVGATDEVQSIWVSNEIERAHETGLRYKLINNKTEYQVIGAGTASGDVVMESTYRGKPVTSIAAKAFATNKKITSLTLGEYVKEIGKNAFVKSDITSIYMYDGVTTMGEYAFQSCKKLESVTLSANLTSIPAYTFSWCSALKEVTIGNKIESIGKFAFSNCEALTSVSLPSSLKTVGEYAFSDCKTLASVSLGGKVETIEQYAFSNCAAITAVDFGTALISIGKGAFGNCATIAAVVLPDSATTVEQDAFKGCTALASVTLGTGIGKLGAEAFLDTALYAAADEIVYIGNWIIGTKNTAIETITPNAGTVGIGDYAFANCKKLMSVSFVGIEHIGALSFGGCPILWEVIFDDALVSIGDSAFYACSNLSDVKIGSNVKTIGSYAFQDCSRLSKIDLPDDLVSIGSYAFNNTLAYKNAQDVVYIDDWAVGLKNGVYYEGITIKEGTHGIANYSFYKALILGTITIPDSVKTIGRGAFYDCMYAFGFTLPAELKTIGDYAFYGCISAWFTDFEGGVTTIPYGTESIGRSAFYKCSSMVGLVIPGTVKTIGDYAFFGCNNLGESMFLVSEGSDERLVGEVVIGDGVEKIGDRAFYKCTGLAEIVLPDSVTSIGMRSFYNCTNLKTVVFGNGIRTIPEYSFYKCEALESIVFSDGVTSIGKYAFRGCVSLGEIRIGEGVEFIDDFAFFGCTGTNKIVIPNSVKTIGNYVFRNCASVQSVIVPDTLETLGKHSFYGMNSATLYCEGDAIAAYWSEDWNSSYRPVVWGCELSEDNSYVVCVTVTDTTFDNHDALGGMSAPKRDGYTFFGWETVLGSNTADYTAANASEAPVGTVLYAIWHEGEEQPEPEIPEEAPSETPSETPSEEGGSTTEQGGNA